MESKWPEREHPVSSSTRQLYTRAVSCHSNSKTGSPEPDGGDECDGDVDDDDDDDELGAVGSGRPCSAPATGSSSALVAADPDPPQPPRPSLADRIQVPTTPVVEQAAAVNNNNKPSEYFCSLPFTVQVEKKITATCRFSTELCKILTKEQYERVLKMAPPA